MRVQDRISISIVFIVVPHKKQDLHKKALVSNIVFVVYYVLFLHIVVYHFALTLATKEVTNAEVVKIHSILLNLEDH